MDRRSVLAEMKRIVSVVLSPCAFVVQELGVVHFPEQVPASSNEVFSTEVGKDNSSIQGPFTFS